MDDSTLAQSRPHASGWVRLPVPFDRVEVSYWTHIRAVHYSVFGFPDDLVAAGAIEPAMAQRGGPGKRCIDSHGNRFVHQYRATAGANAGKMKIERLIRTLALARTLPGVPADLTVDLISRLTARPLAVLPCQNYSGAQTIWAGSQMAMLARRLITLDEIAELEVSVRKMRDDCSVYKGNERCLYSLLDGFVGVVDPAVSVLPGQAMRPVLRLVVDNTVPGERPHLS